MDLLTLQVCATVLRPAGFMRRVLERAGLAIEADDMADLDRHRLVLRNRHVREHGEATEMTLSHIDLR